MYYKVLDTMWASLIALLVKNLPAMQISVLFLCREDRWRRNRLPTPVFLGFSCGSVGKPPACNLGSGRSPREGKGSPLQYSGLENSMDCIIHGVSKSWTELSDFHSSPQNERSALDLALFSDHCTVSSTVSIGSISTVSVIHIV